MSVRLAIAISLGLACAIERPAAADVELQADLTSSSGAAFHDGLDAGGYTRLDADLFIFDGRPTSTQALVGYAIGLEGWTAPGCYGFGLPILLKGGLRFGTRAGLSGIATMMRLGLGISLFQIDSVTEPHRRGPGAGRAELGGGLYMPTASVDIGVGDPSFRLAVEARVSYRWEWIIEDRAHVQLGLALSFPLVVTSAPEDD